MVARHLAKKALFHQKLGHQPLAIDTRIFIMNSLGLLHAFWLERIHLGVSQFHIQSKVEFG